MSGTERVAWVSSTRAVCLLVVVFIHALGGFEPTVPVPSWLETANQYIVQNLRTALGPFFLISGMLAARTLDRPAARFYDNFLRRFLYPYALWSFLTVAASALAGAGATNRDLGFETLATIWYEPVFQFWFLAALIAYLLLARLTVELGVPRWTVIVPAAAGVAYHGIVGIDEYFPRMLVLNAPVFIIGLLFGSRILELTRSISTGQLATVAGLGVLVVAWLVIPDVAPTPGDSLASIVWGLLTTVAIISWMVLLDRTVGTPQVLVSMGDRSLEIYAAHVIFVAGTRVVLVELGIDQLGVHIVAAMTVGLAAPLLIGAFARWRGVPVLFSYPGRLFASAGATGAPGTARG